MISVSGVSHHIGGKAILNDISVDIPTGSLTALIGPNGAGKSTLLNLMSRQESVQTGAITLDGADIKEMDHSAFALRLAMVAQNVGVASRLRIRDLVSFGRWPHSKGRHTTEDVEYITKALKKFGLEELSTRFLDEVSGGQKQRAFVAMAFAQETDWLLLDEPLNNLDLRHGRDLMRELHGLTRMSGKNVVIILHDLNYAMAWADHVVAMKNGRVAFAGQTSDVMTNTILSQLYGTDVSLIANGEDRFVWHHR